MKQSLCTSCRYFEEANECGEMSSTGTQVLSKIRWIEYHCLNGVCIGNKYTGLVEVVECSFYKRVEE